MPLISQSARLKTNKVCKQFCTSGCFMSWTAIYLGLNLKKFISFPGKGTVPAGGFVPSGVLARLLQSNSQLRPSFGCLRARVIHSTFLSPSNTSVVFRNVYKCQQAGESPRDWAGSRGVWSSPGLCYTQTRGQGKGPSTPLPGLLGCTAGCWTGLLKEG